MPQNCTGYMLLKMDRWLLQMNCGLQFWGGGSQHITLVFGFIIHIQSKACYVQDVKFPTDSLEPFRLPFLSEEFPI